MITPEVLDMPFTPVLLAASLNVNNESFTEFPAAPLAPRANHHFGCELTLGRGLEDVDIVKVADNGTSLEGDWKPTAEVDYPVARDFLHRQEAELEAQVVAVVWIQGNGDARDTSGTSAAHYQENLTALHDQILIDFPETQIFVLDRYPFGGAHRDEVRAAQEAFVVETPGTTWINTDDLKQAGDDDHYGPDGFIVLGQRLTNVIQERL